MKYAIYGGTQGYQSVAHGTWDCLPTPVSSNLFDTLVEACEHVAHWHNTRKWLKGWTIQVIEERPLAPPIELVVVGEIA